MPCWDPLSQRYIRGELAALAEEYCSDEALYLRYVPRIEGAHLKVLAEMGFLSLEEVEHSLKQWSNVNLAQVHAEEAKTRHDLKAVVNCLVRHSTEEVQPFVHLGLTSYDVLSNAHILRYRDMVTKIVIPFGIKVLTQLIRIAREEADTICMGRTHGQYAEPMLFGYVVACYVDRLGWALEELNRSTKHLRGKLSGAVGGWNTLGLLTEKPHQLEQAVLAKLKLKPRLTSSQIVHPEPGWMLCSALSSCFGVLANLADDMRNLQRSEIAEVAEYFAGETQVGSSAMPHKQNPISWENIKSLWKTFSPMLQTAMQDQISEHQRDLTNSASARFMPRYFLGFAAAAQRAESSLSRLVVCRDVMRERVINNPTTVSGPLQTLLASVGCPDAHEIVRRLCLEVDGLQLIDAVAEDPDAQEYWNNIPKQAKQKLYEPEEWLQPSRERIFDTCDYWEEFTNTIQV